jgi:predicted nuclease of predicted toxin-antitoxin system
MIDRIRFITYQSKQILLVDLSNCSASEVETILRSKSHSRTQPPSS